MLALVLQVHQDSKRSTIGGSESPFLRQGSLMVVVLLLLIHDGGWVQELELGLED